MSRPLGSDRPYPQRVQPLPRRLDEVTADWLTGVLANRYPGVEVREAEQIECKNTHTTKLRLRLELNAAGIAAGIPERVCLKANWSGMRTGMICERESRFYHLIRDRLDCPVPHAYLADWDADGRGNGLVVMEDLADAPGAFGSSDDHLGIDGVAAGLESLARLHGALWGSPELDRQTWLPRSMSADDADMARHFWHYIRYNLADPEFASVVPDWVNENPALLDHVLTELAEYELGQPGPMCLVHGDAHQGNSFLRADGQRVWVDWQMVRSGSPWRDVCYLVVGALTVEERRAADRDLVEHYRQRLLATGAAGVPDADAAWQRFVRWPGYGMQAWLGNVNQWGQRSGAEMVRRQFAAADDYDTVALLTRGKQPRRAFVPGEGALGLAPDLAVELERRLAV